MESVLLPSSQNHALEKSKVLLSAQIWGGGKAWSWIRGDERWLDVGKLFERIMSLAILKEIFYKCVVVKSSL